MQFGSADRRRTLGERADFIHSDGDAPVSDWFLDALFQMYSRDINAAFQQRDAWRHYHPGRFWGAELGSDTIDPCSPLSA